MTSPTMVFKFANEEDKKTLMMELEHAGKLIGWGLQELEPEPELKLQSQSAIAELPSAPPPESSTTMEEKPQSAGASVDTLASTFIGSLTFTAMVPEEVAVQSPNINNLPYVPADTSEWNNTEDVFLSAESEFSVKSFPDFPTQVDSKATLAPALPLPIEFKATAAPALPLTAESEISVAPALLAAVESKTITTPTRCPATPSLPSSSIDMLSPPPPVSFANIALSPIKLEIRTPRIKPQSKKCHYSTLGKFHPP
jgi:hypothetical protein